LQDPIEIAADTGARLDALGVDWVIGGSIASSVHGEPRSTQDVDMVVALLDRHVTPFTKVIGRDYYVDAEAMRVAVRSGESFNAVHFASAIKVDFFVAGNDAFEAERLRSRQRIEMPNGKRTRVLREGNLSPLELYSNWKSSDRVVPSANTSTTVL
jgi:hypothetical protein